MGWYNSIKNCKYIIWIFYLFIIMSMYYIFLLNINEGYKVLYIIILPTYIIIMIVVTLKGYQPYFILLLSDPKVIKSEYGKYLIIKNDNYYTIYDNKWIFLKRIPGQSHVTNSLEDTKRIIKRSLDNKFKYEKIFDKWDGITSDSIKRDMTIDKIIK